MSELASQECKNLLMLDAGLKLTVTSHYAHRGERRPARVALDKISRSLDGLMKPPYS